MNAGALPGRTCRYPGCAESAESSEPGAGRKPEYCADPGHTRASAWRARKREQEQQEQQKQAAVSSVSEAAATGGGAPSEPEPRPTAGSPSPSERLITEVTGLLEQLRTVSQDRDRALQQLKAVHDESVRDLAAAFARADRAERAAASARAEAADAQERIASLTAQVEALERVNEPAVAPTVESPSTTPAAPEKPLGARAPNRPHWWVVQVSPHDPPDQAVVLVSRHASQSAADHAAARQRSKYSTGRDVIVDVRRDRDITSYLRWDTTLKRGVVQAGPPK